MALKRSAAASPPCSTSEVCFASRRPRSAAASPHGRVPCGGSAPLVPLFLCRAVGASSKLKGGARKVGGKSFVGAPSRGGLRERKTSCRRLFNAEIAPPGAILQSARALFSRRATPPRGSNGRSLARDPPRLVLRRFGRGLPRRPPPSAAVPLDCLRQPRKFTALGFSWAFFGANPPRKKRLLSLSENPKAEKRTPVRNAI